MTVYVDGVKVKVKLEKRVRIGQLIRKLGFTRETLIAKVNGKIVTEFDTAGPEDKVEFVRVSTGG